MKYKRTIIVLGIFVIAVILGIMLLNIVVEVEKRKALENIQIELVDISIQNIGFSGVDLDVSLDMYNPNDVTATLDRSEYKLWFNENYLGEGRIQQETEIPSFTSKQIHTKFNLSYSDVGKTIVSTLTEEQRVWRIMGTAYYDSILGTIDVPFDITR